MLSPCQSQSSWPYFGVTLLSIISVLSIGIPTFKTPYHYLFMVLSLSLRNVCLPVH